MAFVFYGIIFKLQFSGNPKTSGSFAYCRVYLSNISIMFVCLFFCIRFIGLIFLFRLQRYDKELTYAAAAKERSGFIGDNLRKNSIFAVKIEITAANCDTHLALSSRQSAKPATAMQEPFQVSSMAVLYLYKDVGGAIS